MFRLLATVAHDVDPGDEYLHLSITKNYGGVEGITVDFNEDRPIFELARIEWRVGEWVKATDHPELVGQVVAMHEGHVWLRNPNGEMGTLHSTQLEPASDPAAKPTEPPPPAADEPTESDRAVTEAMAEPGVTERAAAMAQEFFGRRPAPPRSVPRILPDEPEVLL